MQQDTQLEAAKRTGVSQKTISNWLSGVGSGAGQRKPEAGNVAKFATGYGESVLVAFVAARLLAVEHCEGRVAVAGGLLVRAGSASTAM